MTDAVKAETAEKEKEFQAAQAAKKLVYQQRRRRISSGSKSMVVESLANDLISLLKAEKIKREAEVVEKAKPQLILEKEESRRFYPVPVVAPPPTPPPTPPSTPQLSPSDSEVEETSIDSEI